MTRSPCRSRASVNRAAFAHYASIFGPSVAGVAVEHRDLFNPYTVAFAEMMVLDSPAAYLAGLEIEGQIDGVFGELFERYDALICPTLTIAALPVDAVLPDLRDGAPLTMAVFDHMMTIPFNIASRCPVLNVPSGFAATGVPTGVQLVARTFEDETSFRLGAALERAGFWDYATRRPRVMAERLPA